jgi:intracellular sulfur oxidation DsrE/DsrF family protein
MKKTFLLITFMLLSSYFLSAQKHPLRIVFDVTSHDTVDHRIVLRWMNEELNAHPDAVVEAVFYGKSLDMITQNKSTVSDLVSSYAKKNNVSFKVCEVAMKNNNLDKSQLIPGVQTVPDGIGEIVSKQQEGWGYIKVSH